VTKGIRLPRNVPQRLSKRPKGMRATKYTALERYQILELHRRNPEMPYGEIARLLDRAPDRVRLICLAADKTVIDLMAADAELRLEEWAQAARIASARGDHRPAKEWLMHSGALDQLPDVSKAGGPAVVIINAPLPGMPGGVAIGGSYAPEIRQVTEGHQSEHSDGDRRREAAEASGGDRAEHGS
jgi:hypothetical protein